MPGVVHKRPLVVQGPGRDDFPDENGVVSSLIGSPGPALDYGTSPIDNRRTSHSLREFDPLEPVLCLRPACEPVGHGLLVVGKEVDGVGPCPLEEAVDRGGLCYRYEDKGGFERDARERTDRYPLGAISRARRRHSHTLRIRPHRLLQAAQLVTFQSIRCPGYPWAASLCVV